ncbi:hypothetical protein BDZ97DRAFT_1762121 [Flammula alnicola]|nr:hypothetical protein BDZ97DRAFT_1762121 [Flammula alnicola]
MQTSSAALFGIARLALSEEWHRNFVFDAQPQTTKSTQGKPCPACVKLKALDEQIARLQHERQCLLKTQINLQHDPFIHCLPVEIASHIFTFYVDDLWPTRRRAPLRLAAVCKVWREIAFSTPRIWTSTAINLNPKQKIPPQVELASQWLSRSGKLPLFITLNIPVDQHTPVLPGRSTKALFQLLRTYAPRWKQLDLFIPPTFHRSFLSGLRWAPLLEYIKIANSEEQRQEVVEESMEFRLDITPSLKRIRFSDLHLKKIFLGLDNLTSLEVDNGIALDEILEMLSRAPRLVHCRLSRLLDSTSDLKLPTAYLTHSSLEDLYVSPEDTWSERGLSLLCDQLKLPSLQSFTYTSEECKETLPVDSLVSLFGRSHSPITRLSLRSFDIIPADGDLIHLLESLPTITHLSLSLPYSSCTDTGMMTDLFLNRFAMVSMQDGTPQDIFLPRLQSLQFTGYRPFSWQRLMDLFEGPESTTQICSHNTVASRFEEISPPVLGRSRTRRPLDYCKIELVQRKTDPQEYIDKNALAVFVNFQKSAFLSIAAGDGLEACRPDQRRPGRVFSRISWPSARATLALSVI